jgi:hypothetical protein
VERTPAVLPAGLDLLDTRVGERVEHALCCVAVRDQLELPGRFAFLESFGRELDEARPQLLGLLPRDRDRDPDQRNALFSFAKKPSSWW